MIKKIALTALFVGSATVSGMASATLAYIGGFTINGILNGGGTATTQYNGSPAFINFHPSSPAVNTYEVRAYDLPAGAPENIFTNPAMLNMNGVYWEGTMSNINGIDPFTLTLQDGTHTLTLDVPGFTIIGDNVTVEASGAGFISTTGLPTSPKDFNLNGQQAFITISTQRALLFGVDTNSWSASIAVGKDLDPPGGVPEIDAMSGTAALTLLAGALALASDRRRKTQA